ncbi:GDP-L-fucose synthase family protein [Candidatus Methylopumilus universalis]|uniref:GDP-L-fucose synthase family protein n=1 Tax=Candidatus Methylopumilus universalis TaxID=2588536 RepID=UPI003BEED0EA
MNKLSKIYIAGHKGLVGSALIRQLIARGYTNIIARTHTELDLLDKDKVSAFFKKEKPEYVILAAAKVGGIYANNTYPAEFIYQNLEIQNNVIHNAYLNNVKQLLFLGSSCIYPRDCPQPIKEEYLLTGPLEATNRPYALAKIAGIEMIWSYNRQYQTRYLAVMPTNLYGPEDSFDLQNSHVLPALIRKMHEAKIINAKEVVVWGTGKPMREFLINDDMADACIHLLESANLEDINIFNETSPPLVNIGSGTDISIEDLANQIKIAIGFAGNIVFDSAKPDGTMKKLLDVTRLKLLGWKYKVDLKTGIEMTYKQYLRSLGQ